MSELAIDLGGGPAALAPGEKISGVVSWALAAEATAVELRLFWYTRGKGTTDVKVVEKVRFERPGRSGRREFSLTLPDSPYSFSGKLISLIWALELVSEPETEPARVELVMSPSRSEIVLAAEGV